MDSQRGLINKMNTPARMGSIVEKRLKRPCVNAALPQITGMEDKRIQEKVNKEIIKLASDMTSEGCGEDGLNSITGEYEITFDQSGLLSIRLEAYSYRQGAAHGLTVVRSLTADLEEGWIYELEDLFRPGGRYRAIINEWIENEIRRKGIPLISDFDGISENQDYYLAENSVVVYFQLYEYTPYAYGIPEFFIPFRVLKEVIGQNSPLRRLI